MRIIAYTYEADYHCIDCTIRNKRFQHTVCSHYIQGKPCNNCRDSNGLLYEQKDSEGNFVHPVFSTDEWQDFNQPSVFEDGTCAHDWDWQCVCSDTQYLACGDCHDIIETYTHKS